MEEGGVFQSASSNYSFVLSRDRTLVANFTLPTFAIAATNNPVAAGTVSGQGTFFYGVTNVLRAEPKFGYSFENWTENGVVRGTAPLLQTVVYSNRVFAANYAEANLIHDVTTATLPDGLATVTGAGA